MTNYPILLFWDEADRLWVADVPDVRFCSAHGETAEEALRNVTEALADIHADAAERGVALPPPTKRPVLAQAS
jgi:predicted RNase H-like HicB family nuclease